MKAARTPVEARATPGLKLLTPLELALIKRMTKADRERWAGLLARNKWRAAK
jgi:hypothetical protein